MFKIWRSLLASFSRNSARSRRKQYFPQFFPYNFRLEVDNDVISGLVVEHVGMDVHEKVGDSRSNGSRDIRGADFVSNERTLQAFRLNILIRFKLHV